jgi:endonuclease/exonuclease/phosphatase family metal-dependent hydrolase
MMKIGGGLKMSKFFWFLVCLMLVLYSCASRKPVQGIEQLNKPVVKSYVEGKAVAYDGRVQVIAYNIERGIYWQDVAHYLSEKQKEFPATILLLSELDRMHSRSGDVFVAEELAKALKMNMVFVTEFVEYNDKTKDTQGDHGNAILSPFPLSDIKVIRHTDVYSWTRWGWLWGQPRKGERVSIGATALLPDGNELRVYTVHFESHATSPQRVVQMKEVLEDAKGYKIPVVIGGDFNEFPGGMLFHAVKDYGFENSFEGNNQPTGSCGINNKQVLCAVKIDWLIHRGLNVLDRRVDYPMNSSGGVISDHSPVRAIYKIF